MTDWGAPDSRENQSIRQIYSPEASDEAAKLTVFLAKGGWWCRIDKPGWFMERGPYCFKWQARMAFPIQRWRFAWPEPYC